MMDANTTQSNTEKEKISESVQSLLSEVIQWQTKTALMKRRKRLLLEELYFSAIECEDEPRKKKKGDLFTGAESGYKMSSQSSTTSTSKNEEMGNTQENVVVVKGGATTMKEEVIDSAKEGIVDDTKDDTVMMANDNISAEEIAVEIPDTGTTTVVS